MNTVLVFFLVFVVAVSLAEESTYTTKYDKINIDALLSNKRLTDTYVKCLLDQGKCNEEGKTLKSVLPDALISDCKKCSGIQKVSVEKVIKHLIKERRTDFDDLTKKYDPTNQYRSKYQHYIDDL